MSPHYAAKVYGSFESCSFCGKATPGSQVPWCDDACHAAMHNNFELSAAYHRDYGDPRNPRPTWPWPLPGPVRCIRRLDRRK